MNINDKIDFFKDYAKQENEKKDKIYNQFFYYLSIISIQVGFLGYYLLNLPPNFDFDIKYILSFVLLACFIFIIILFIFAGIYIYRFIYNGSYGNLPYPNEIKQYIKQLEDNFDENKQREEFQNFLYNSYVKIVEQNTKTNESRQANIVKIRNLLSLNILFLFLTFIPYYILSGKYLNSYKVIILKENKILKTKEKKEMKEQKENVKQQNSIQQSNNSDETTANSNNTTTIIQQPNIRIVQENYDPLNDTNKSDKRK